MKKKESPYIDGLDQMDIKYWIITMFLATVFS